MNSKERDLGNIAPTITDETTPTDPMRLRPGRGEISKLIEMRIAASRRRIKKLLPGWDIYLDEIRIGPCR